MLKVCSSCKIEKPKSEYHLQKRTHDGLQCYCKSCKNIKLQEYKKKKLLNSPQIVEKSCSDCNTVKPVNSFQFNPLHSDMYNNFCKECKSLRDISYRKKNVKKLNKQKRQWFKEKLKKDPVFHLMSNIRARTTAIFSKKRISKSRKLNDYIGCELEFLFNHIQKQFKPNMTWDNYGDWHIDHIIPLSSADSSEKLYQLCHYTNLQPLWASENFKKGNKY